MSKERKVRSVIPATNPDSPTLSALKLIAGESKEVPLMSTKLQPIRYVPTIFSSFNRASVIGGAPLRSTYLIHGPSGSGKSAFAVGLVNSFVKYGHAAAYIDAEHAVSKQWFGELGTDMNAVLFEQPDTFENAVALVDKWIGNFKKAKADGKIEPNKGFIIVVDTIHKLVPKNEMQKLLASSPKLTEAQAVKKINDNIAKGWGRYRANLISVWIDKMTPIVGKNDVAFVAIAHEADNPDKDNWGEDEYKVKGGKSLIYESMVRVRITSGGLILMDIAGGKKMEVGAICQGLVAKNKVGYPREPFRFFLSNGKGDAPIGFDMAREIFEEGVRRGEIKKSSSWYYLPDDSKFQGEAQVIEYLRDDGDAYQTLFDALTIESEYECV